MKEICVWVCLVGSVIQTVIVMTKRKKVFNCVTMVVAAFQADEEDAAAQFLIPRSEIGKNVSMI